MAMTKGGSVPNAGTSDAGYTAPTPHAAVVAHQTYEAPTTGAGIGAGAGGAGTDMNPSANAGSAIDKMIGDGAEMSANNDRMGGGMDRTAEQPCMGDDSNVVFGAEYQPNAGLGGGTPKALDEMAGLQPGTGYGNVNEPVASPDKGLDPGATGYGSATGTGNQGKGPDRRIMGGETKTDGGWQSL